MSSTCSTHGANCRTSDRPHPVVMVNHGWTLLRQFIAKFVLIRLLCEAVKKEEEEVIFVALEFDFLST